MAAGKVVSLNLGRARQFDYRGRPAVSAIWKSPVVGRVTARGINLEGDEQADRDAHGGQDKAVYAYAIEDLRWWEDELGRGLDYGQFGENLTTEGVDVTGALVGERWESGNAIFEVSEPRIPCWRFAVRMEDNTFPKRFTSAGRPGAYLRIAASGDIGAGDEIRVVDRPDHGLTIGDVFRIYTRDQDEAERLLRVPGISMAWQRWAEKRLDRKGTQQAPAPDPGCC